MSIKKKPASEFWLIDTDTPGMSRGQLSASGPYPTLKAAESALLADIRNLWEDSCTCLKKDSEVKWCLPYKILELAKTVQPEVSALINLKEIKP